MNEIGNYNLLEVIAEGGMGTVWKGQHKSTGVIVAIKIIPPETAKNPLLLRRFEHEFRAASLIDHPNVVKPVEYSAAPVPFIAMEFVDGKTVGQLVEDAGRFLEEDAIQIISQVCEGLHRAHKQGLIHRDIKPDNILVNKDQIAKLTDMGLVKDLGLDTGLTRTGRGLGTPFYMAPEQFRQAKNADVRCDVYSLGATLYHMVTGVVPFANLSPLDCWLKKSKGDIASPRSINPKLSERIDFAIRRSMMNNPLDRPASCREFMEDILGGPWRLASNSGILSDVVVKSPDHEALWYMVYYDDSNSPKTVKGTTETIRRSIENNKLGDLNRVVVSRTKTGPFNYIKNTAEFRDLLFESQVTTASSHQLAGNRTGFDAAQKATESPDRSGVNRSKLEPATGINLNNVFEDDETRTLEAALSTPTNFRDLTPQPVFEDSTDSLPVIPISHEEKTLTVQSLQTEAFVSSKSSLAMIAVVVVAVAAAILLGVVILSRLV